MRFLHVALLATVALPVVAALPHRTGASDEWMARHSMSARPVVLLVHGRGYLHRDSAEFRREALQALRQGAFNAANDSLLGDDDVRIVWYADLLDSRRQNAASVLACGAAESKQSPSSVLGVMALLASALLDANAAGEAADDMHGLAGDLRFLGDPDTRCSAEKRLADALARAGDEGRPVVLVAHSLGALVSWGHLKQRGAAAEQRLSEIRRLVTVGSPLGSDDLRQLLLLPGDRVGPVTLPQKVRSWVNVVNEDDPFAARLAGASAADAATHARTGIADVMTQRLPGDPHELRGYLRDPASARAVLGAWCEAFESRDRGAGCGRMLR